MIRVGCVIAIMNSTASVRVSLITLSLFIIIGVISNRLKPRHLQYCVMEFMSRMKELQILFQSEESSSGLQLDLNQYQQVRNELLLLKSYLLEVQIGDCVDRRIRLFKHRSVVTIKQNQVSSFIHHIWFSLQFIFVLMSSQVIFCWLNSKACWILLILLH